MDYPKNQRDGFGQKVDKAFAFLIGIIIAFGIVALFTEYPC